MKLKVLVLGSTGMIGHQVYKFLESSDKYKMFNISYRKKLNKESILCDITDQDKFINIVKSISPDFIINCIGILIEEANLDIKKAIFINAYFPHKLMSVADELKSKLIHISTDCVFSGNKKTPYVENDFKDGKGTYAKSKGLGEIINENHLTLRTSVIGPELKTNGEELFHWFMSQSGEINGYKNSIWSGVTTLVLAKTVGWAIENNITGLYHVTNNKSIDKFSLLCLIKKNTRKNIKIHKFINNECNKSFIDTREEINFTIPTYNEMVKFMIEDILKDQTKYQHYIIKR
jgi:dTDP-4-dehydrorhamnose reductase